MRKASESRRLFSSRFSFRRSAPFIVQDGRLFLVILLVGCLGCQKPQKDLVWPKQEEVEFVQSWPDQVFFRQTGSWTLQMNVGNVTFKDLGKLQRIRLEESFDLNMEDLDDRTLLRVSADNGFTVYPFEEITLNNVLVQLADSIEIESDALIWKRQPAYREFPFSMPNAVRILTPTKMYMGEDLAGDPLFMHYQLRNVTGLVLDSLPTSH
jgi:hypothetical protein